MKIWRSLLIVFFLCLMMTPASAEKTDWSDSSYDFTKVQKVLIYDITLTDTSEFENDLLNQILLEEYLKNAARPPYRVIRPDKAQVLSPEDPKLAADLYVIAELMKWHDDFYIKPEYTSWESQRMTRTRRNSDGSTSTEEYYITVPVVHPPKRIDTSTVRVRFDVYDSKTGKRVLARDELRVRDDSHKGERGIYGRICKSFFDDFGKKLKNE